MRPTVTHPGGVGGSLSFLLPGCGTYFALTVCLSGSLPTTIAARDFGHMRYIMYCPGYTNWFPLGQVVGTIANHGASSD